MLWKKIRSWRSSKPTEASRAAVPESGEASQTDTPAPLEPEPVAMSTGASLRELPERFLNREISDLALIARVLEESRNTAHPLLERLRFLSISADLLDQFFTVRVSSLRRDIDSGNTGKSPDGLTAPEQLRRVSDRADELTRDIQGAWEQIYAAMTAQGIELADATELTETEGDWLAQHFETHVLPALTPFAIDREHPFPFVPSGGICAIVEITDPQQTILIPLPGVIPRFVQLPGAGVRFVTAETMLEQNCSRLFPGRSVAQFALFQILRDHSPPLYAASGD